MAAAIGAMVTGPTGLLVQGITGALPLLMGDTVAPSGAIVTRATGSFVRGAIVCIGDCIGKEGTTTATGESLTGDEMGALFTRQYSGAFDEISQTVDCIQS